MTLTAVYDNATWEVTNTSTGAVTYTDSLSSIAKSCTYKLLKDTEFSRATIGSALTKNLTVTIDMAKDPANSHYCY